MLAFRRSIVLLAENASTPAATPVQLTFNFTRTASKQLPVYVDYRPPSRIPITVVRKYTGSQADLKEQLQRLVGPHVRVEQHVGRITVSGNYATKIRKWITGLGF